MIKLSFEDFYDMLQLGTIDYVRWDFYGVNWSNLGAFYLNFDKLTMSSRNGYFVNLTITSKVC